MVVVVGALQVAAADAYKGKFLRDIGIIMIRGEIRVVGVGRWLAMYS